MKALFRAIGLFSLLVFVACHGPQREARRLMVRAEQLLDTMPDSTFCLIDSVLRMDTYLSERNRMEMALLQGEALFRHVSVDDEDIDSVLGRFSPTPELEQAAAYYAARKAYAPASHAALYSGYVQQYFHDKTTAMQSYKEAEQYGTLAEENLVVARARCKIGKMLFGEYLYDEALSCFRQAECGFEGLGVELSSIKNMMAVSYIMLHQFDSAEICLKESLQIADGVHSSSAQFNALNNYYVLYRQKKEYDLALDCLKQMSEVHVLDSVETFRCYLNLGQLYLSMGDKDSAVYYLKQMEELMPLVQLKKETKLTAYGALIRAAKVSGDDSLALQYREMHEDVMYEAMRQRLDQTVYRIRQRYNYEYLQNTMNRRLAHAQWVIVFGLVLLFGVIVFFLYRSVRRNKKEAEINANLFHFMRKNEELLLRNEEQSKAELAKSQQLSDLLMDKMGAMQKLDYYLRGQGDKRPIKELEKQLFEGKSHLEAINEVVDRIYPGLRETVKAKYPQLSDLECEVYLLSRFKFSRVEEATLLNISTSVLDKARGKVRRIMIEEQG